MPENANYLIVTEETASFRGMVRLKLGKPPGPTLKTLARQQLAGVARQLEAAAAGGKVHGARRGLKVARSTLRLLRGAIGEQSFAAADGPLRAAARLLAGARHREALGETIDKLGDDPALQNLKVLLADASSGIAAAGTLAEAGQLVMAARKTVSQWALPKHDIAPLLAAMAANYGAARRKLRRGLASGDGETLHAARKAVIHHLHHIEMLAGIWPPQFKTWAVELNGLRQALGDLNDLDELERALGGLAEKPPVIAARREQLLAKVASASGLLFAEKPKAFAARMKAMWRHAMD